MSGTRPREGLFCFRCKPSVPATGMELKDRLTSVIEPVVNGLGYELVLLEYAPSRGQLKKIGS